MPPRLPKPPCHNNDYKELGSADFCDSDRPLPTPSPSPLLPSHTGSITKKMINKMGTRAASGLSCFFMVEITIEAITIIITMLIIGVILIIQAAALLPVGGGEGG